MHPGPQFTPIGGVRYGVVLLAVPHLPDEEEEKSQSTLRLYGEFVASARSFDFAFIPEFLADLPGGADLPILRFRSRRSFMVFFSARGMKCITV